MGRWVLCCVVLRWRGEGGGMGLGGDECVGAGSLSLQ